jgi:dienelactone hydrolase
MIRPAALLLGLAVALPALAADDLSVLREADGPPGTLLYRHLETQAKARLETRKAEVAALRTPEQIAARQARLKASFREALGAFPERTPLNPQVTGREDRDGYRVEKVIFESRPGHHVTAALFLPDGPGPHPGVLVPCGHSANGKAAETYQRACILLAKNGLAALCTDPIGQGERIQLLKPDGKPAVGGSTTEHTMVGIGALLVGRSAAHYRVWDEIRALDYLESRPDIDPKRLGVTGNSGGGTLSAYVMALDDRVAAAAPSCYITSFERLLATIGPQDAEQNVTGQIAFGMDHADYLTMRAPRPTLMCVGTRDYFDIDGAWASFREAKLVYGKLGHGERMDLFEFDDTHGFSLPRRQAAMRWLRRWLLDRDDAPSEEPFPILTDAQLQVTRTGQVLTDFSDEVSAFKLNADRAAELAKERAEKFVGRTPEALREAVRARLAIPKDLPKPTVETLDRVWRDGVAVDRYRVTTEPGVVIPLLVFRKGEKGRPLGGGGPWVLIVGADRAALAPGGAIEARVNSTGATVAVVEPRGTGESAPVPPGRGEYGSGPFGKDEREAFLGILLGRPLLAQRTFDVLQAIRALAMVDDSLRRRQGYEPVGLDLVGIGPGAPIALHAALLEPRAASLELDGGLVSWTALAQSPLSKGQLSSVLPGVLAEYDLPDLVAAMAPRPVTVRNPADPQGRPIPVPR